MIDFDWFSDQFVIGYPGINGHSVSLGMFQFLSAAPPSPLPFCPKDDGFLSSSVFAISARVLNNIYNASFSTNTNSYDVRVKK